MKKIFILLLSMPLLVAAQSCPTAMPVSNGQTVFFVRDLPTSVLIRWDMMPADTYVDHYEVERSLDGHFFSQIQRIPASQLIFEYAALDRHPIVGRSWYRLKVIKRGGVYYYTDALFIEVSDEDLLITKTKSHECRAIL